MNTAINIVSAEDFTECFTDSLVPDDISERLFLTSVAHNNSQIKLNGSKKLTYFKIMWSVRHVMSYAPLQDFCR